MHAPASPLRVMRLRFPAGALLRRRDWRTGETTGDDGDDDDAKSILDRGVVGFRRSYEGEREKGWEDARGWSHVAFSSAIDRVTRGRFSVPSTSSIFGPNEASAKERAEKQKLCGR